MAKQYRIGVIGHTGRGDYGHGLDTAWLDHPNCKIVAVSDPESNGLEKAAQRLGVEQKFTDYRKMLDAVQLDIVALCPRWIEQHRDMAVAVAERGIHFYMEKPLARTLAEADEIVSVCERTHAKLALALPTRYSPKLQIVKQLIHDGAIGRVLEYRGRGKEDRRGGGEDLWVLGTHVMDMIRALGGHPEWCFARVTQEGKPVTKRNVTDGAEGIGPLAGDAVHAMYGMSDGSTATFQSVRNTAGTPLRYGLQIFGSRGIIEIQEGPFPEVKYLNDPSWSPGRSGSNWQNVSSKGIGELEPLSGPAHNNRHDTAIKDLIAAIEQQRQPICSVYDARGATEMIAAVFESHRIGGPASLPLSNRQNPLTMLE
ncbi:MAG: Gfo/Idh/MocA family oxidoreductase [Verrucomicrobia bacterium]|nr:Gfo/Idh/MocA family oxidoreductase [Verrucomicrobiota bacterium]